jgi:Calcineurin-like phosphoesterase
MIRKYIFIAGLWVILAVGCVDLSDDDDSGQEAVTEGSGELPESYPGAVSIAIMRGPYLQNVGVDYVTVMWEAEEECSGLVEYWSGDIYGFSEPSTVAVRHEQILTGLPAHASDISYRIRCISDGDFEGEPTLAYVGEQHAFRLAPAADEPFRFTSYGDNRTIPIMHGNVIDVMVEAQPDLTINTGDLVLRGHDYWQWDTQFFLPAAKLMKNVPLFVAIGNHEEDAEHFYDLFSQPLTENYFSFSYGNSFMVIVDSNSKYLYPGCPQLDWLEETLQSEQALEATWIFGFCHHPPYSEGWDSPGYIGEAIVLDTVLPLAEEYGVDMFFNGHTHDYERGKLNGVTWIITGGGGASLDSFQQDFEHIVKYESAWHFTQIDVDGPHLEVSAIDIYGETIDYFELDK